MMDRKQYDAVIIGFGKGGKTLAGKLAVSKKRVALVERSAKMYGGSCINVACIPTKSLIHSASVSAMHPERPFEEKAAFYADAVVEKRRVTGLLRQKNYEKLAKNPMIDVYTGEASFASGSEVQVRPADGSEPFLLVGTDIYLNTGAEAVIPPIPGLLGGKRIYTSETLMEEDTLPRRLAIIGGGYIGTEFTSMFTNFGSTVTVLQDGETFLPREDQDVSDAIRGVLERRGVTFLLGVSIQRVEEDEEGAHLYYLQGGEEKKLTADAVLVATGRRPATKGLNLEAAGVEMTPGGAVKVDETLRTSAPHIWAMGDVNGGPQFTYISLDDSRVIWSQQNGGDYTTAKRQNIPNSVFVDPPFSRVGLNEREAKAAGINYRAMTLPVSAIPKAQLMRTTDGMLKALVEPGTGKILGAALFCEESHELINTIKLAMDLGADYTVFRDRIFNHPTMSEALNDLFAMADNG